MENVGGKQRQVTQAGTLSVGRAEWQLLIQLSHHMLNPQEKASFKNAQMLVITTFDLMKP